MDVINLLENLEDANTNKEIYGNAVYVRTGPMGQESFQNWLVDTANKLQNDYPLEFTVLPDIISKISPISLIDLPARRRYKSTDELPAVKYIPERSEIEAQSILDEKYPIYKFVDVQKVYDQNNEEKFHKNDARRGELKTEIKSEFERTVKLDRFSSEYKLNSGYAYVWSSSKKFIDVIKGYDFAGVKHYERKFIAPGMTEEDVEERKKELYIDNHVMEFRNLNVDHCAVTFSQLTTVLKYFIVEHKKKRLSEEEKQDIITSITWYSNLFKTILISIAEMISGVKEYTESDNTSDIRVGRKGTNMTHTQFSILETAVKEILMYDTSNLIYKFEDNYDIHISVFMNLIRQYVPEINSNLSNQIDTKNFNNIIKDKAIFEAIENLTSRVFRTFMFEKSLFEPFNLYGHETYASYNERIHNIHVSGLNSNEADFIALLVMNFTEDINGPLIDIPEEYVFNYETFINTIYKISGVKIFDITPKVIEMRRIIATKKDYMNKTKELIENELTIEFGPIIHSRHIELPSPEFSPDEKNWIETSKKRIFNNITKLINQKDNYNKKQQQVIANEVQRLIIRENANYIPDTSFLSPNYTFESEDPEIASIEEMSDMTFSKIKEEFDLYQNFLRNDFQPVVEDFVFSPKDVGLDMTFKLTDKMYIKDGKTKAKFADTFYEQSERSLRGEPNSSERRKIIPGGGKKIAEYFYPMFAKFVSVNKENFNIVVEELIRPATDESPERIDIVMYVRYSTDRDVYLASKFMTMFFSSDIKDILRANGWDDSHQITKFYEIYWSKSINQIKLLSGDGNAKTLKMYEDSLAMTLQYPFYNGRFYGKREQIMNNFIKRHRERVIRTKADYEAEQERRKAFGTLGRATGDELRAFTSDLNRTNASNWNTFRGVKTTDNIVEPESEMKREQKRSATEPRRRFNEPRSTQRNEPDSRNSSNARSTKPSISKLFKKENKFNIFNDTEEKTEKPEVSDLPTEGFYPARTKLIDAADADGFITHRNRKYKKAEAKEIKRKELEAEQESARKEMKERSGTPYRWKDDYNPDNEKETRFNSGKRGKGSRPTTPRISNKSTPNTKRSEPRSTTPNPGSIRSAPRSNSPAQMWPTGGTKSPSRINSPYSDISDDPDTFDLDEISSVKQMVDIQSEINNDNIDITDVNEDDADADGF